MPILLKESEKGFLRHVFFKHGDPLVINAASGVDAVIQDNVFDFHGTSFSL